MDQTHVDSAAPPSADQTNNKAMSRIHEAPGGNAIAGGRSSWRQRRRCGRHRPGFSKSQKPTVLAAGALRLQSQERTRFGNTDCTASREVIWSPPMLQSPFAVDDVSFSIGLAKMLEVSGCIDAATRVSNVSAPFLEAVVCWITETDDEPDTMVAFQYSMAPGNELR
jgi:hypothetical protein